MVKRSLKTSTTGVDKAKRAFERKGWTQEYLAAEVGLSTRQSVWKFLTGRPIERHIFIDLCFQLDLDWQDIADLPQNSAQLTDRVDLNNQSPTNDLVTTVKQSLQGYIESQCRYLQSSLDVAQPLLIESIYTSVNILRNLSNQRWLEVTDLQNAYNNKQDSDLRDRNESIATSSCQKRFSFAQNQQNTRPAIEALALHKKLIILGKPGAGKTTFLQYLAFQCIQDKCNSEYVPIFISLRLFATQFDSYSLIEYIINTWSNYNVNHEQLETLLQQGRILLLLDGLDEVSSKNNQAIIQQLQDFADTYYQNQIIVTCRLAAQQYHFQGFTYVELADFNSTQIETFVRQWFIANSPNNQQGLIQAGNFLEQLELNENQAIKELVVTPILLSLICSVFQEKSTFPSKRSKLYEEGLDILLVRWDRARGIHRDRTYHSLSLPNKITLLSEIAATTFERGNYFFEKNEVLEIIANYLLNLQNADTDPETLRLNSEAVLQAIEVQHGLLVERAKGIYSFSHLTFQEYLTARKIVASPDPQALNNSLKSLVNHIQETQWREVILLTASILPNAEFMLQQMKQTIDNILSQRTKLQQFVAFLNKKNNSIKASYSSVAVRAFYFSLFHNRDLNLAISLDPNLASNLANDLALDLALTRALSSSLTLLENPQIKQIINFSFAFNFDRNFEITPEFRQSLEYLTDRLPNPAEGKDNLLSWWQSKGEHWVKEFKKAIVKHRYFGLDWVFSEEEQSLLHQYYIANQFLVECLNTDVKVNVTVQTNITKTILQEATQEESERDRSLFAI
jgi:predicted NACHT family NTPase